MLFSLFETPGLAITAALAIMFVIALHEFSHALVARTLGDKTAEHEGRLTLNPFAHLDPIGTILLLMVGFGWGKPVPFNPYNLKFPKWGPALVALAGPISNFVWAILFSLIMGLSLGVFAPDSLAIQFLFFLVLFNIILGLFNLIPIPPLDGSKVLFALLPPKYDKFAIWLQRNGSFLLIALLIFLYASDGAFFQRLVGFFLELILGLFPYV